jgi:hypothetical protein
MVESHTNGKLHLERSDRFADTEIWEEDAVYEHQQIYKELHAWNGQNWPGTVSRPRGSMVGRGVSSSSMTSRGRTLTPSIASVGSIGAAPSVIRSPQRRQDTVRRNHGVADGLAHT